MPKYGQDIVADVLAANDIVDVIGAYVDLKSAGAGRFKTRCPFHQEKTPSFTVSRDRQQFYCFGCQKHGDAIDFVREHEGLTFVEALRKLADRGGIRLPALTERDGKEDFIRSRLSEFGNVAAAFYRATLEDALKGSAGRMYLKSRELKVETVRRFGLGYAPDGWSGLVDHGRAAGFKDNVIEASGLARRGDRGGMYDFFRNRLMIPIHDVSGRVVAFGGRILAGDGPKYINSPENVLYRKSRVLYGLYEGREAIRREKRAILVEGYFDLMRCFDAGIENVVAPCGTALTGEQAALIRRYAHEVVIVFDADAAGIRAALRGVGLLVNEGLTVRALTLPDGKDPDDFVRAHGADVFSQLIKNALDFVSFYVAMSRDRLATIEGRTEVAREIFGILALLHDTLRQDEYVKRTARELGLDEWTCRGEFSKFLREQSGKPSKTAPAMPESAVAIHPDEPVFIAALLDSEPQRHYARTELADASLQPGPVTEVLRAVLAEAKGDAARRLETDAARALYAAAAACLPPAPEKMDEIVRRRVARLLRDALKAEVADMQRDLDEAQRAADDLLVSELNGRIMRIRKEIERIGAA